MHRSAHLDIFEVLVLETNVPDGCHAQNFGFITRLHLKNIEIRNQVRVEKKKKREPLLPNTNKTKCWGLKIVFTLITLFYTYIISVNLKMLFVQ